LKGLGTQVPKVAPVITAEITSVVSGITFEMVRINGGTFLMGSPPAEPGRDSIKETQHPVTLTSGFYMGKYEITQAQYEMVMGETIAEQMDRGQGDNYPMYYVSYYDALVFCNKLSMLEGLSPAYRINGSTDPAAWGDVPTNGNATWNANIIVSGSTGYRLPTEAQWEYSCRAGSTEAYNWGTNTINQTQAQYNGNPLTTAVVGSYAPNDWGLYDMHGNVDEWCWDWYRPDYGSTAGTAVTDPMVGASSDASNPFIIRGGNFQDAGSKARSANRGTGIAYTRHVTFGFRIIRP
jgi:formylglycine-generating enzyme required for sulfatase activity